jgi:hypothetical protein
MGDYFTHKRKMDAVNEADSEGTIADSMDVRRDIVRRMHAGAITLDEGQAELAAIKRGAEKAGKTTRAKAYSRG